MARELIPSELSGPLAAILLSLQLRPQQIPAMLAKALGQEEDTGEDRDDEADLQRKDREGGPR